MRYVVIFFVLLFGSQICAQGKYPIQVNVTPPYPFPTTREAALKLESFAFIHLVNTDGLSGYNIMLSGSMESDNGLNVNFDPNVNPPTRSIKLGPGEMISLSALDLQSIFPHLKEEDIAYEGIDRDEVIKTQQIPEGVYIICVQALDFETGKDLSAPRPMGCSTPSIVSRPEPPFLILPRSQSEYEADYPLIECRWMPSVGSLNPVEYHLQIIKTEGADPYDLFRQGRSVYFEKKEIMSNIFLLDDSHLRLPTGQYAVRVTAYDPLGQITFSNQGHSDIHEFAIKEAAPEILITYPVEDDTLSPSTFTMQWQDDIEQDHRFYYVYFWEDDGGDMEAIASGPSLSFKGPISTTSDGINLEEQELEAGKSYIAMVHGYKHSRDFFPMRSQLRRFHLGSNNNNQDLGNYSCGGEVVASLPSNRTPVSSWVQGDEITVGLFTVRLASIQIQGNNYSGTGIIVSDEFFTRDVEVQLNDLKINRDGKAFSGSASANAASALALFQSGGRNFGLWEQLLYSNSSGLPFRKNDLLVTSINLTPTGAKADFVSAMKLAGSRSGQPSTLWFTEKEVKMNPAGFENNNLRLNLDEDVTFRENSLIEYVFQAKKVRSSGGRTSGGGLSPGDLKFPQGGVNPPTVGGGADLFNHRSSTSAKFDCDGVRTVRAKGLVKMNSTQRVQLSSAESITGYFNSDFTNWGEAMGFVQFNAANKNQLVSETVKCDGPSAGRVRLELTRLRPFDFFFCTAIMDHSFSESPGDENSSWTGIYLDQLDVVLPAGFNDVNNDRLSSTMAGRYDGRGFHAEFDGPFSGGLGKVEEWVAAVTNLNLEVSNGNPIEAKIEGGLIFPFAYPIQTTGFDISFSNANGRTITQVNMDDLEELQFRFTPWNAQIALNNASRINANYTDDRLLLTTDFHGTLNFNDEIGGIPDCDLKDISFNGMEIGNSSRAALSGIRVNSFNAPNGDYEIAGYRAEVTEINLINQRRPRSSKSELHIGYEFELDNLDLGFLGETNFKIYSKQGLVNGIQSYSFDKSKIEDFSLSIDIPVIKSSGTVSYKNTAGEGKEFQGTFATELFKTFGLQNLELEGRFGRLEGYKYWAVAARGDLTTNVDLTESLAMNSFGGGMSYNMLVNRGISPTNKYAFSPSNNRRFSIFAGIGLEHKVPGTYAGTFGLRASFDKGNFTEVELNGNGHFFYKGNAKSPNETILILDGAIRLNFSRNPFFEGEFNYILNIDDPRYSIIGESNPSDRSVGFHFSDRTWYIRAGRKYSPISATLSLKNVIGGSGSFFHCGAETYFETGRNIPVRFGVVGYLEGHNNFNQELIFANEFKLDYGLSLGIHGSLGRNNAICRGVSRDDIFGNLGGFIRMNGSLEYYDRCDDWNPLDWDWDGDGDDGCDEWRSVFAMDLDVSADLYGFEPLGGTCEVGMSFTVVKEFTFNKSLTVGQKCN